MKIKQGLCWLLFAWFKMSVADEGFKPMANPRTVVTPRANISVGRSLHFEDEDISAREASYYQFPLAPPPYAPPPVYGPPPEYPEVPEGNVEIEFLFNELIIECIAERPFEHIIWTRFPCPNQLYYGEGLEIADGSHVNNEELYDVHLTGFNGITISELTIRDPTGPESSGLYRCEAWPHFHRDTNGYQPYGHYQYYTPVESDVFIIGGNSLLENCYGNLPSYPYGSKVTQAINQTNKKPLNHQINKKGSSKIKENSLKNRRNATKTSIDRKDTNAKYLRYNLKFDNEHVSDKYNKNITLQSFLPSSKFPFQQRQSDVINPPKGPTSQQLAGNITSSIIFDFLGNNNKIWQSKYGKTNLNRKNVTIESLARKSVFPQNQAQTR